MILRKLLICSIIVLRIRVSLANHNELFSNSEVNNSLSHRHDQYDAKDAFRGERLRKIRSDTVPKTETTSIRVESTSFRMVRNRTWPSLMDQMHVFFAERAREDAYQKTEAEDHPYSLAYLIFDANGTTLGMCSGSLVTTKWVVTAAHCLADNPVHSVKVFAGIVFNVFHPPARLPRYSQVRVCYEFLSHPRYDPSDCDFDVGLIKIEPEFRRTRYVAPVAMTSTPWDKPSYRSCSQTAFGRVRDKASSPDDFVRKTQELQVKKPCDCSGYLESVLGTSTVRRYACMRPISDFGICSGDSGGGLICGRELVAVASLTFEIEDLEKCKLRGPPGWGECGDVDAFSVWQDLYPSIHWIKKNALRANTTKDGSSEENNSGIKSLKGLAWTLAVFVIGLSVLI